MDGLMHGLINARARIVFADFKSHERVRNEALAQSTPIFKLCVNTQLAVYNLGHVKR